MQGASSVLRRVIAVIVELIVPAGDATVSDPDQIDELHEKPSTIASHTVC